MNEENLDRDPPSPGRFRFQVIAREKTGIAASTPLSFVVTLNDVNDNAPQLPMVAPITVQAGEARREVIKVGQKIYNNLFVCLFVYVNLFYTCTIVNIYFTPTINNYYAIRLRQRTMMKARIPR